MLKADKEIEYEARLDSVSRSLKVLRKSSIPVACQHVLIISPQCISAEVTGLEDFSRLPLPFHYPALEYYRGRKSVK